MRTRRGECYPRVKKIKAKESRDLFDELPDDLVTCILCRISSTAASPADFVNVLLTCKRINNLALGSMVLSRSSIKMLTVRAENWCDSADNFLKRCADSSNIEACYILGMIRFYCLQNQRGGALLMAKAAINSHAPALYSLAVIQFNGSGGSKADKDLRAGVALCVRAAFLGHVDALRELGHCLQDGYGVTRNIAEGRRFLVQANTHELANATCQPFLTTHGICQPEVVSHACEVYNALQLVHVGQLSSTSLRSGQDETCLLLSDFGCDVPAPEAHPASKFLAEWYSGGKLGLGLWMCSHKGCGRPEMRRHEFRRCSVCGAVNYCSRACQALDWKLRHKGECVHMDGNGNVNGQIDGVLNGEGEAMVEI